MVVPREGSVRVHATASVIPLKPDTAGGSKLSH
jgi:hypothetical protein